MHHREGTTAWRGGSRVANARTLREVPDQGGADEHCDENDVPRSARRSHRAAGAALNRLIFSGFYRSLGGTTNPSSTALDAALNAVVVGVV